MSYLLEIFRNICCHNTNRTNVVYFDVPTLRSQTILGETTFHEFRVFLTLPHKLIPQMFSKLTIIEVFLAKYVIWAHSRKFPGIKLSK